MKAVITGESERVGVNLLDNNDVEHVIEMEFDGKIKYHEQDGYPDKASNRPKHESEHINQARRFAKWHVYRERGYETLPRYENPDAIVGAMLAIIDLADEEFDSFFGDLIEHSQRHSDGDPGDLPFEANASDTVVYCQDIWLDDDPTESEPPLLDQYLELASETDVEDFVEHLLNDEPLPHKSLPSFEIEAVSDVHYKYTNGISIDEYPEDSPPLDRTPDARIELLPLDVDTFGSPRLLVVSHLRFQIRDRFVEMGLEPPEVLDVNGPGAFEPMVKQRLMDMYEEYYRPGGDEALPSAGLL